LNLVVTEALFVITLVSLLVATWPDVPWTPVLVALVATNLAFPLILHPISRTTWVALERKFSGVWE
jgi:hypothetical protein